MTNEFREVFLAAAEMIREGWCQGVMHVHDESTGNHCRCVVAAIEDAVSTLRVAGVFHWNTIAAVNKRLGLSGYSSALGDWNDEPGRTQDEVIALLESVASQAN